ncbi:uncharacterized protein N7479_009785 [Penicillium vulpinum]|uniref:Uncharacterized protein n=1 Tax=Penicillium vulpinum TaxID=29845 RepID=A0A1V6RYR4_9EURO|nr:uncharacterized protein N7479_009785 [Penicillium vulpinum]KAJ5951372.1 hypothetical protein N7479_009785 [Penicillium vulpinum]OQE06610.1 hypothetical protein PENVUL_c017G07990 [Penicillium vulpinum]
MSDFFTSTSDLFTGISDQENHDQVDNIRLQGKRERKLLQAIRKNNIAKVNALLADGVSPDGESETAPLQLAVRLGRREIIQLLIQYDAQSPSNPGPDSDDDELLTAAGRGRVEVLKILMDYRKKLGYRGTAWPSHRGDEPIHRAANWGNLECLQLLAQEGATINLENSHWETPLHLAASLPTGVKNGLPVLRFLLASGANVNALTITGDTPILMAARVGNDAAIEELLKSSPDITQRGQFGETVLLAAVSNCSTRTVQRLVGAGADIHLRTKLNASVLHLAAESGKIKTFKWILDNSNLAINDIDCHNWTPLHFAACKNQVVMAKYLLEHGADPSIASTPGDHTPLHLAAAHGYCYSRQPDDGRDDPRLVEYLIQYGADMMAPADSTTLHVTEGPTKASQTNMYSKSEGNTSRSSTIYPLHCAVMSGAIQRVKALLSAGADIHVRTAPEGETALHLAAKNSFRKMVLFLIQNGLDYRLTNNAGYTMVHYLSLGGQYEPVSVKDFLVAENLYDSLMESELVTLRPFE